MEYELSKREIDLISDCLNYRINYYEGLLLLMEFQTEEQKWTRIKIKEMQKEIQALQTKTTYIGQDQNYILKRK